MTTLIFDSFEGIEQRLTVLDLIPDTHAWAKDRAGRFVFGNRLFFERFGIQTMQGLLGKTDFDLAPEDLAQRYTDDDKRILNGGTITDKLEIIIGDGSPAEWFLTSKWPIYTSDNCIIGSLGISRHLNQTERKAVPYRELNAPIAYIHAHFAESFSVKDLAQACNLSVSALERRFNKHLNQTPHRFLNEVRLDHARRLLLETSKSIGTIALETGFADHSHFTRAFNKHFALSPRALRQTGS